MAAATVSNLGSDQKTLTQIRLKGSFTYDGTGTHCPFYVAFRVRVKNTLDWTLPWVYPPQSQSDYTTCNFGANSVQFQGVFQFPANPAAEYEFQPIVMAQDFTLGIYREGPFDYFTTTGGVGPVCDLSPGSVTATTVPCSATNYADGSITITTTSSEPHEFACVIPFTSINNWQDSPTFAGLEARAYTIYVRHKANHDCIGSGNKTLGVAPPEEETEEPPVVPVTSTGLYFSLNPILEVIGAAPEIVENSEVVLELSVESEHYKGDFQPVIARRRFLTNDSANFDLNLLLHSFLNKALDLPYLQAASIATRRVKQGILNYSFQTAFVDPVTKVIGAYTKSPVYTVVKGGLPLQDWTRLNFFGYLQEKKSFLTWLPKTKTIGPDQPEFLYWLNQSNTNDFIIERKYIGVVTTTYKENFALDTSSPINTLISIPVKLEAVPAHVKRIEIRLLNSNQEAISETRTFKIDRSFRRYEKFFLYENAFGVWETLRTTGPQELAIDGKDEISISGNDLQSVFAQDMQRRIKQSSGLHTPEEQEYLQGFVFSKRRYEIKGEDLLPIILQKRSYTFEPDSRRPTGYFFEYDYAYTPFTYSHLN
ncbi:hypothetical protein [Adhaeribacter pallidiroseus]|uniref:Uncharacterized protein n=1 Tax=Adhaeribacter pallidiroseus TaxID=2072847 RepID=A0A369QED8_9BACT|nr:hypothetical protein [Adhaeribacter pallidiroseus]RDC63293.1 hypothetical protein AHMF7616_01895 [Adhaeribacter pallidiroseus]